MVIDEEELFDLPRSRLREFDRRAGRFFNFDRGGRRVFRNGRAVRNGPFLRSGRLGVLDIDDEDVNISPNLTLRSVRIVRADLDDDEEELVEFIFNEPVLEILDEKGFLLIGPDSDDVVEADSAVLAKGDPRTVLAGFDPGTDVRSFTLGGIATATVANRNREVNVQDTAPLAGLNGSGLRGPTSAPDLLFVGLNSSLEWVHYVFDETLEEGGASARDFGFYTRTGRPTFGSRIVSIEDNVVTVAFARGAQVQKGVRFFVVEDAVKDLQGHGNPLRAVGGGTTRPDLVSVRRVGDTGFDFTFDEPVAVANRRLFVVYTAAGRSFEARAFTRRSATVVRAFFPQVNDFGSNVVVAGVEAGAVIANDGSGDRNTVGARTLAPGRFAQSVRTGRTTGPDLISVDIDRSDGLVSFNFDEPIDTALDIEDIDEDDFFIITSAGELSRAIGVVDVEGNSVVVLFKRADVRDARGATVVAGAVTDREGNPNPPGTILR